jgi:hypothetical protein
MPGRHDRGASRRRTPGAAALAAALALAAADAVAAAPHPAAQPGAFCTRPGCAGSEGVGASRLAGFALASLACIGLDRARRRGTPPA